MPRPGCYENTLHSFWAGTEEKQAELGVGSEAGPGSAQEGDRGTEGGGYLAARAEFGPQARTEVEGVGLGIRGLWRCRRLY